MVRTRTWFFAAFTIGGLFETIGFICRMINATETPPLWTKTFYIIQFLLILLAPAFFAASIYMGFGRIILLVDGEVHSLVKKKWLTKLFVFGDVLSFVVQAIGASILAQQNPDTANLGKSTILAGLGIQVMFFGFFLFNIVHFWLRIYKAPTAYSKDLPWKKHSIALLTAGCLILSRCVYRIIEYIEGKTGELQSHEVYLYILDAGLMLIVMIPFHF
ncbi:hypothetical protein V496_07024 [Pseudogymnoascus sp. VKM F-4515 (FW-2607)]|nr:hypothetical protein V496_07024 [Pseudogymnoascus sp. VKM F-4515 (FW-2607)]KFY95783.1 hypothetical protein V498_03134 [Pseudogymnoascus sp. VKM F-4517 (FW-2822)]